MHRTSRYSHFAIALALAVAAMTAVAGDAIAGRDRTDKSKEKEKKADKATRVLREATGIRFSIVESYIRRSIISTKTPYGFKIRTVDKGSPARRAGLRYGDIVLRWNGKPVRRVGTVADWIRKAKPGSTVVLDVASRGSGRLRRGWQDRKVEIVLRQAGPAKPRQREI